jgi:hypothetical protein
MWCCSSVKYDQDIPWLYTADRKSKSTVLCAEELSVAQVIQFAHDVAAGRAGYDLVYYFYRYNWGQGWEVTRLPIEY